MKFSNSFPQNVSAYFYVKGCSLVVIFLFFSRPFSQFFIAYTKNAKHNITFFLLFKTDSDRFYVCTTSVTIKQAAVTLA